MILYWKSMAAAGRKSSRRININIQTRHAAVSRAVAWASMPSVFRKSATRMTAWITTINQPNMPVVIPARRLNSQLPININTAKTNPNQGKLALKIKAKNSGTRNNAVIMRVLSIGTVSHLAAGHSESSFP